MNIELIISTCLIVHYIVCLILHFTSNRYFDLMLILPLLPIIYLINFLQKILGKLK